MAAKRDGADAKADCGLTGKVLAVLQALAETGAALTLKEIADGCGLPPATAHRLLRQLVDAGFAAQGPGRRYRGGIEFFRMAARLKDGMPIVRAAHPVVGRVAEAWEGTGILCLYSPSQRSCTHADLVGRSSVTGPSIRLHERLPLTWGAAGRVMLAHVGWHEAEAAIRAATPSPLTGRSLPSHRLLLQELRGIRDRGYATSCGELTSERAVCIATPLMGSRSTVLGSLAITLPRERWDGAIEGRLGPWLVDQGMQLSHTLSQNLH